MLRIIQNTSAQGASSYFAASDYYTEEQELPGVWRGEAARQLGLSGKIEKAQWEAVCHNRDPRTGLTLMGSETIDDGLRDTLAPWGEQVHRIFTSANLNLFAGTGIPASPETHIPAVLSNTSLDGLREARENPSPLSERQVLDDWLRSKAGPLLVLAPFGTGKSVLLWSFADQASTPRGTHA
jgi:hypothetical protein